MGTINGGTFYGLKNLTGTIENVSYENAPVFNFENASTKGNGASEFISAVNSESITRVISRTNNGNFTIVRNADITGNGDIDTDLYIGKDPSCADGYYGDTSVGTYQSIQLYLVKFRPYVISLEITVPAYNVDIGKTLQATAIKNPTGSTATVYWNVTPGSGSATISDTGVVTGISVGFITISATSTGPKGETITSNSIELYVTDAGRYNLNDFTDTSTIPKTEDPVYTKVPKNIDSGIIFAGWYQAKVEPINFQPDVNVRANRVDHTERQLLDPNSKVLVYPRFVNRDILQAKVQIAAGTTASSDTTALRFITTTDTRGYGFVGFKIEIEGRGTAYTRTNTVYSSIKAFDGTLGEITYSPSDICGDSTMFMTYVLRNIPNKYFNSQFTVTPYWITMDGTLIYGTPNTFKIAEKLN